METADPVESAARKTAEQIDAAALALAEEEAATEVVSDVATDIANDTIDQEAIDQEETAIQVANEAIDQVTVELDQDAEEKASPISEAAALDELKATLQGMLVEESKLKGSLDYLTPFVTQRAPEKHYLDVYQKRHAEFQTLTTQRKALEQEIASKQESLDARLSQEGVNEQMKLQRKFNTDLKAQNPNISEADLKVIRQLQERLAFERLELGKKHLQLRQSFHLQETAQTQDRIVDIEANLINLPIVINAVTEGKIDSNDALAILRQLSTVDRSKRAIAKLQLQRNALGTTKENDWRRKELTKDIDRYQSTMDTAKALADAALSGGPEAYQNALHEQEVAGDKYPSSTGKGLPQPSNDRVQKTQGVKDHSMTRRFKILQGEVLAGNDNPMIIKELTHLITKLKSSNMLVSV